MFSPVSAKIVKKEYINSELGVTEVNRKVVALYLAVTTEKADFIKDGIYHLTTRRRRQVRGRKPTVRNPKVSGPLRREERN